MDYLAFVHSGLLDLVYIYPLFFLYVVHDLDDRGGECKDYIPSHQFSRPIFRTLCAGVSQ
jgi:hypothetical protein